MKKIVSTLVLASMMALPLMAQQQEKKETKTETKQTQTKSAPKQEQKPEQKTEQKTETKSEKSGKFNDPQNEGRGKGRELKTEEYQKNFGENHRFRVNNPRMSDRFEYGGRGFTMDEAWPPSWGVDDDVYVVLIDGIYYLVDPQQDNARILISVEF
jgi:Ni/Co efflux regulator RcnB